jgi:hypothetical protein
MVYRHGQSGLADDVANGLSPLGDRFAQLDPQVGPRDGQNHTRDAAASADVQHALTGFQVLAESERINDVSTDEFLQRRVPRQIDLLIERPKCGAIEIEPGDLVIGQFDVVPRQGGGQRFFFGRAIIWRRCFHDGSTVGG